MIIRDIKDMQGTDREVAGETWISRRLILAKDRMGFSFHETIMRAGTETRMWYKNHFEAVYCIEGKGTIEDLDAGKTHDIYPGMLYGLDKHDRHVVRVEEDLRLMCVFNPPVTGRETHDEEGAFPLLTEEDAAELA